MTPGAVMAQLRAEGRAAAAAYQTPYHWAAAYALMALALAALSPFNTPPARPETEGSGHETPSTKDGARLFFIALHQRLRLRCRRQTVGAIPYSNVAFLVQLAEIAVSRRFWH